jgi:tetratricopeptide (TPR) repeat protein
MMMKTHLFILRSLLIGSVTFALTHSLLKAQETFKLKKNEILPFIESLILKGKYDNAADLLRQLKGKTDNVIQEDFLLGQIAFAKGNFKEAAKIFTKIIDQHPTLTRVRLDLARALYMVEEDGRAAHHFELAISEELPAAALDKVNRFLYEMRLRKRWSFRANFGIAPDTNLNAAPDRDCISDVGLCGKLSRDARQQSGIGFHSSLGFDYFWKLGEKVKLKTGISVSHTRHKNSIFNNTFFSGAIGPRVDLGKSALTVQAIAFNRWFGGKSDDYPEGTHKSYNSGNGVSFTAEHVFNKKWRGHIHSSWVENKYNLGNLKERDGPSYDISFQLTRGLTSSSMAQIMLSIRREVSALKLFRNTTFNFSLGYYQDFGHGITAYLKPGFGIRKFQGIERNHELSYPKLKYRKDNSLNLLLHLTKRDFVIFGFAPTITYTYGKNMSNIAFYSYDRHRVNFGFTRVF